MTLRILKQDIIIPAGTIIPVNNTYTLSESASVTLNDPHKTLTCTEDEFSGKPISPIPLEYKIQLQDMFNTLGRIPTNAEIDQHPHLPSYRTFLRNFGGMRAIKALWIKN